MEQILFSNNMIKFYDLFKEETGSAKECAERLEKAIPLIADELNLGKCVISLNAPVSLYDATGTTVTHTLYTYEGGHDEALEKFDYSTGEHGKVFISAYPRKGYVWSEAEKESLRTFSFNVFFLCGRARLIDMMKKVVVTDNVTGMYNITGFMKFASEVSYKVGLEKYHGLRFNIKNFSILNKALSKVKSNDVLRAYGNRIKDFLKDNGTVARLGGDNFVALVKNEYVNEFLDFLEEVPIGVDNLNKEIKIGARVGVCDIHHKDNIGAVMDYLDVAAGIAKYQGRDVVYFEQSMIDKVVKDKAIGAAFPYAIKNREFQVYFQPKINILDNTLCGCEALVRWIKDGKIIPPMDFIPVLEEDGTVCELDFYVLEESCKRLREWLDKGYKSVNVSVNFSKLHLKNRNTVNRIFELIDRYHIEPSLIEIELTEMSGYDNFQSMAEFIEILADKGIRTSIDDFGTGYSSLNLLTRLGVDVVKLDKSFSNCIEDEDNKNRILLHNIVDMVHELDYKVIAEGVETEQQAEFLKGIGCSMVQGYLFDKPLPASEFEKRLSGEHTYNN